MKIGDMIIIGVFALVGILANTFLTEGFGVLTIGEWLVENWQVAVGEIFTLAWLVVRATPTEKDNDFLRIIQSIFDGIIPNRGVNDTLHKAYKKPEDTPPLGNFVAEEGKVYEEKVCEKEATKA